MNRIDACFQRLAASGRKAFVSYLVAGDPSPEQTPALVGALARAGADIIELGVPFSDPLADGVVNQLGSQRALQAGTGMKEVFSIVRTIRQTSEIPIVLFTYFNPVFRYGLDAFVRDADAAGVDGVLILDLPPEEAARSWPADSPLRRITLVAPTTPQDRIDRITGTGSGFIYYVSREGVTGMQSQMASDLAEKVARLRAHSRLPVCVGFGISNPDQARAVAGLGDGVVVGSALVHHIATHASDKDLPARLFEFAQPLVDAVHQS
jgi:tryptophan synthase alpha chain